MSGARKTLCWIGIVISVFTAMNGMSRAAGFTEVRSSFQKYYNLCVAAQNIWLVGERGAIIHGDLSANAWEIQESGAIFSLNAVDFIDAQKGLIAGDDGVLLKTGNGGKKWHAVKSANNKKLLSLTMVDENVAWAVGDYGTIICSMDGGDSWEEHCLAKDRVLNDVYFIDRNRGWIVGEMGMVLHTADGGENWAPKSVGTRDDYFFSIKFRGDIGVIVGAGGAGYFTSDGGDSWHLRILDEGTHFYGLELNDNQIIAVGYKGVILECRISAEPAGIQLSQKTLIRKTPYWLSAVQLMPATGFFAAGNHGTLLFKKMSGGNWDMK